MKHKGNWFWGIFLVLAAVVIIAMQFGSFATVGFWTIAATVLLAAIFIYSLLRLKFGGIFIPLALLYIIYQAPLQLFHISPWILLLAAALVSIGLSMIIRPRRRHVHADVTWNGAELLPSHDGSIPTLEAENNEDDNHPYAKVSFGATSRYLHSSALESGEFTASFGAMEVFFDQARVSDRGAEIRLECSFGSIKLYIPKSWHVVDSISTSLGGVENDTRFARPEPGAPTVTLTGEVSFGSVEVQYV